MSLSNSLLAASCFLLAMWLYHSKKTAVSSLDFKRSYKMIGNYLHIDGVFSEEKERGARSILSYFR